MYVFYTLFFIHYFVKDIIFFEPNVTIIKSRKEPKKSTTLCYLLNAQFRYNQLSLKLQAVKSFKTYHSDTLHDI
jgi:hypothetical protein